MKYSMYIGRVGALAVALGIGAAVATSPGIAFAQESESGSSDTGAESPSSPPANQPDTQTPDNGSSSNGDSDGSNDATDPPDMNVSATTTDTSTNDTDTSGDDDEDAVDTGNEDTVVDTEDPTADGEQGSATGESGEQGSQGGGESGNSGPQQQSEGTDELHATSNSGADDDADLTGAMRVADGGVTTRIASFKTTNVDDTASGAATTFNSLALDEETEAVAQSPVSTLFTLPLRIVSNVLSGIIGGGSGAPGENPLVLGLLAFVRRQFENTFGRTFVNHAPDIKGYSLTENQDGTFTITVDPTDEDQVVDPDGDPLTFTATDGEEGTVEKTGPATFVYTPGDDFDGDTITLTVSDRGGLLGFNRMSDSIEVEIEAGDADPTQPEITQPPAQQEDGSFEAKLEFDPTKVTGVEIAEGAAPKYWNVTPVYNAETGELELELTPTQAGMLRAALGLDTTDSVGLAVATTETQTVQTFALRSASFAALADAPDYTLELPDIPAGHFEVVNAGIPTGTPAAQQYPGGVVVTDDYTYVLNSRYLSNDSELQGSTVAVFDANNQLVKEIQVGENALFAGQAGDRIYVVNLGNFNADSTISVIDTTDNTLVDVDDSTPEADPIVLEGTGSFSPIMSPDGKRMYVINQQTGMLVVVDTDPGTVADPNPTYNTIVDEILVAPGLSPTPDPETGAIAYKFAISGAFNEDGSRLYVVRDIQSQTPQEEGPPVLEFDGEIVVVNTETGEVIGDPVSLGQYGGYASSDGKFLYVPTLDMSNYSPTDGNLSNVIGNVTVVDIQGAVPVIVDVDPSTPAIDRFSVGKLPINIAFSPDKSLAYVVDAGTGTITVIDTVNQEVLDLDRDTAGVQGIVFDETPSVTSPITFNVIGSSPDGTRLYVSNFNEGTITAIEFVRDV